MKMTLMVMMIIDKSYTVLFLNLYFFFFSKIQTERMNTVRLVSLLGLLLFILASSSVVVFTARGLNQLKKVDTRFKLIALATGVLSVVAPVFYLCEWITYDYNENSSVAFTLCRIFFGLDNCCLYLAYVSMSLFWFERVVVCFRGMRSQALNSKACFAFRSLIAVNAINAVCFSIAIPIYTINERRKVNGVYRCEAKRNPHTTGKWMYWTALTKCLATLMLMLNLVVCFVYVRKLRKVFTSVHRMASGRERLVLRKTILISIASVLSTLTAVMVGNMYEQFWFIFGDLFINSLLISAYFEFGRPIYSFLFWGCERYRVRFDICLFDDMRVAGLPDDVEEDDDSENENDVELLDIK